MILSSVKKSSQPTDTGSFCFIITSPVGFSGSGVTVVVVPGTSGSGVTVVVVPETSGSGVTVVVIPGFKVVGEPCS